MEQSQPVEVSSFCSGKSPIHGGFHRRITYKWSILQHAMSDYRTVSRLRTPALGSQRRLKPSLCDGILRLSTAEYQTSSWASLRACSSYCVPRRASSKATFAATPGCKHWSTMEINRLYKLTMSNMPIPWTACSAWSQWFYFTSIISNSMKPLRMSYAAMTVTRLASCQPINPRVPGQHCSRAVSARNSERLAAKTGAAPQCYQTSLHIFALGKCFQFVYLNRRVTQVVWFRIFWNILELIRIC